jgi:hypothetical protein
MKLSCLSLLSALISAALLGCSSAYKPAADSGAPLQKAATVTVDKSTAGGVTGTISFKGKPPKFPAIDMTSDPGCPAAPQAVDVVVVSNGKLANVFVYVKDGLPRGRFAPSIGPAVLTQKGCSYSPHVFGVMVGQPLKVLNEDTAEHNIHSMSSSNPAFNESQMPRGEPVIKTFELPEMNVPVECNQHPWMRAYMNVMPHPYFAVSGSDGGFTIKDLPPGEYTLAAVHEKYGEQTVKIKVGPRENVKADFSFAPAN